MLRQARRMRFYGSGGAQPAHTARGQLPNIAPPSRRWVLPSTEKICTPRDNTPAGSGQPAGVVVVIVVVVIVVVIFVGGAGGGLEQAAGPPQPTGPLRTHPRPQIPALNCLSPEEVVVAVEVDERSGLRSAPRGARALGASAKYFLWPKCG